MLETIYIFMFAVFILISVIFGIMSIISGFWYAKDIFTPTRKSVLMSGMYMALAMFSCVIPSLYFSYKPIWVEGISPTPQNIFGLLFGTAIFLGIIFSPILAYVGLGYIYASSIDKKQNL